MRREIVIPLGVVAVLALAAVAAWQPVAQKLLRPVADFFGFAGPQATRMVDLPTETAMSAAARRLIQPFGGVRLIRTMEAPPSPVDGPEPPAEAPASDQR